ALAGAYSIPFAAAHDKRSDDADKLAQQAVKDADSQNSKVEAKFTAVKKTQDEVRTVLAGQDERLNQPRFSEWFAATLPRPGEKGNVPPALWKDVHDDRIPGPNGQPISVSGPEAVNTFEDRLRNGIDTKSGGVPGDEYSPKFRMLAMVNVETVYC